MKTYVYVNLELVVDFLVQKAVPTTKYEEGNPAGVAIEKLSMVGEAGGHTFSQKAFNRIMEQAQKAIEKACWEEIANENLL